MEPRVILDEVLPFPGHCALCATTRGPGLDIGVDYPEAVEHLIIGAILICDTCFDSIATMMGYVTREAQDRSTQNAISDTKVLNNLLGNVKHDLELISSLASSLDFTVGRNIPDPDLGETKETEASGHDSIAGQSDDITFDEISLGVSSGASNESASVFGD